ncbi:MAG: cyclic pyranopterin monophosphate synthase MoaC [Promethearchaeota archaeon]
MSVIDITSKPLSYRKAVATGKIFLKSETLEKIHRKEIKKGDPLVVAQTAGLLAVKQTPQLIPFCHPISITAVDIEFIIKEAYIKAICTVQTVERTGTEMEALIGVTTALNNIWDMVKYLEKDIEGQYPTTRITDIQVISKSKIDVKEATSTNR